MHDSSDSPSPGCFNLRRRHSTDVIREEPSLKSDVADDYMAMKQELIARPPLSAEKTEKKLHFTERDLRTDFCTDVPPSGKMKKTKQVAQKIRTEYVANKSWWYHLVKRTFPILNSIRTYKRSYIVGDLAAGISVGIASIPMGMSYARLADLPPAHGLYNNLFYPLIYMLFGTARQVCVGTSAIEAMMSSEAVAKVVGRDAPADAWLNATIGLALCVGLLLILFRIVGLGIFSGSVSKIASFLADPVLSGFSTGSALTIGTSQLTDIFGLKVPKMSTFATWIYVLSHIEEANWICFLITVSGVVILWFSKYANKRWFKKFPLPGSLFVIVIFVLIGYSVKIDQPPFNVKVIGDIPPGLPGPLVFNFDKEIVLTVLQQAAWYSILYFVIHISISKTIAQQRGFVLDANQEFLSLGICSVFGSFFQCFPVATSLSRSSIANVVGAETQLYNIASCLIVALTVTVITPLLYYLPMAALSSVILFGVFFMMYFGEAWRLLKLFSPDFFLWATSCTVTVVWGAMEGVVVSVVLSLLWLLKKSAFPSIAVLGRLPGTTVYRNVKRFPMAQEVPGCKILRFDASLNFSNADQFEKTVVKTARLDVGKDGFEAELVDVKRDVRVVIIDASSINDVDVTAIRMLQSLAERMRLTGRVMLFANWKGPMRDFLDRARFYDVVRPEHCFLSLMDAIQWAEEFYLKDWTSEKDAIKAKIATIIACEGSTGNMADETQGRPFAPSFHYVTESTDNNERQWQVVSRPEAITSLDSPRAGMQ